MTAEKILNIGLVMPIASIDDCPAEHWSDVKSILINAVSDLPGYKTETKIVSEGESVGLIHKRIVQGLYNSDLVICDVSCKNPNVMFELGMRLAFDKPTIIVKDDRTSYSFDTGVIEHLEYPRDLRFNKINDFKAKLAKRVLATYEDSITDSEHSPFLKSFGTFKVATIEQTEAPIDKLVLDALYDVSSQLFTVKSELKMMSNGFQPFQDYEKISIDEAGLTLYLQSAVYKFLKENNMSKDEFKKMKLSEIKLLLADPSSNNLIQGSTTEQFRKALRMAVDSIDDVSKDSA